ncbi:MAG: ABC transporter permease/substrate-binding protein [Candidatus Marinimicrobia bacterium]|nr:ABC transporter permease/substrate-binding protein [Candidatus Neomarinimicrobiota bacterium]
MKFFTEIVTTFFERRSYFYDLLFQHIILSLTAITIIAVIGIGTGILILYKPKLRQMVLGAVNFLYTIPAIAMFGLFIPLAGIGFSNALIVLVIYGLLPVIRNTYTGLHNVDPLLLDAAKGMGATPSQIFFRIRWPLGFPSILSGLRTMIVMTIALAGLASFIGAGGLGQAIYRGINTNNTSMILLGSLLVALLALMTDLMIGFLERSIKSRAQPLSKKKKILRYSGLAVFLIVVAVIFLSKPEKLVQREIVVASKPTAEQYILGEIIARHIEENTNISVKRKFGMAGGASVIHPAMLTGGIDIYPEYTGTAWLYILKEEQIDDPDSLFNALKTRYEEQFGLEWICRFGFNNTYTLAMSESDANELNILTYTDLSRKSDEFVFGAEFDFFEREDGLKGLQEVYALQFKDIVELDINLKFQAMENRTVDVINAFSTDSRIRHMNLRVLKDNKAFFPAYEAGIVARQRTLDTFPELKPLLLQLQDLIDNKTMIELNYDVEINNLSPEEVAGSFLKKKKLI